MTADLLASNTIFPLLTSDTGEDALEIMNEFSLRHLPIVNNQQLLGLLSEEDILNHDIEEPIGSYSLSLVCPYVKSADHVYEVMRLLADSQLSAIPVVGEDSNYAGLITLEDLLHYFAKIASFSEPGSILVMEIQKRDYSLAEIARIVESENALIISCFITSHSTMDDNKMEVTIKVNRQNIQAIIGAFERFDYQIKASFNEINYIDSLRERYDALMSYLNV